MWFRIVKAAVGLFLGILAGIVFAFVYGEIIFFHKERLQKKNLVTLSKKGGRGQEKGKI